MVQWLALSPQRKKVQGSTPGTDGAVWSLHVLLVLGWVLQLHPPTYKHTIISDYAHNCGTLAPPGGSSHNDFPHKDNV